MGMPKTSGRVSNSALSSRVNLLSRKRLKKIRGGYKHIGQTTKPKAKAEKAAAPLTGYYPADDVPKPRSRRFVNRPTKLRASITPGTVLILLSGRYRGKRVVFLKQLESGLLAVTGPFKVNGVPLRRVNQAYVIATSTKVDVSGVSLGDEIVDAWFKKDGATSEQRKSVQASVDASIVTAIKKVDQLKQYLSTRFSLSNGARPHEMVF